MNNLSIEELKKMRKHSASLCHDSYVSAVDELITIRELKGEQVPVGVYNHAAFCVAGSAMMFSIKEAVKAGFVSDSGELTRNHGYLFTAPQKPVVLLPPAYEKSADFTEYHQGWNACRNYMLAEAKEVVGIVKDGE